MMTSVAAAAAYHGSRDISFNRSLSDHDWNRVFRLLSISFIATVATIGNIFTISAIMVDDLLRKKGNSFLVSIAIADMLITAFVLPASSIAILANMENSEKLCQFQYGVGSMSCLCGALFTACIGIENFLRIRNIRRIEYSRPSGSAVNNHTPCPSQSVPSGKTSVCSVFQVTFINLLVWLVSGLVLLVHFYMLPHLMFSICGGSKAQKLINHKHLMESLTLLGICFLVFVSLGGLGLLKCLCMIRMWDKPKPYLTSREFALFKSNFWNWLVRFLIWFPALALAIFLESQKQEAELLNGSSGSYPSSMSIYSPPYAAAASIKGAKHVNPFTISPFYSPPTTMISSLLRNSTPTPSPDSVQTTLQRMLVWPVILPSCLGSLIHAICNKDFRRCYTQLFHYCCCKASVAITRRPRDNLRPPKELRVHMLLSHGNAHAEVSAPTSRFATKFRCTSLMNSKRDVYEL